MQTTFTVRQTNLVYPEGSRPIVRLPLEGDKTRRAQINSMYIVVHTIHKGSKLLLPPGKKKSHFVAPLQRVIEFHLFAQWNLIDALSVQSVSLPICSSACGRQNDCLLCDLTYWRECCIARKWFSVFLQTLAYSYFAMFAILIGVGTSDAHSHWSNLS